MLSRAIQVNAAIYANNVNVVAGSNQVDHNTLAATPIAGSGPAPSVAIDVSALGGMYANRIYLVSNEYGVGVSNKGVLAAQAGDLTLQSNGQLVLAGTTNASGSINASAAQGIQNSGTTYAQHNVVATTVTINYWADYDPHINFDPATEYPGDDLAHKGWHRIEVDRTTTTTTQQDQVSGPEALRRGQQQGKSDARRRARHDRIDGRHGGRGRSRSDGARREYQRRRQRADRCTRPRPTTCRTRSRTSA